jgi:MHS family alpha-ketoglutarate permease-like MFS transporter
MGGDSARLAMPAPTSAAAARFTFVTQGRSDMAESQYDYTRARISARPDVAPTPRDDAADMRYRIRSIIGGSIGNLVEWYDWYVYSAFALYFAHAFFPSGSQTVELLNAAAVFAVGFLMRPIGGWMLGYYADRRGRKAALTLSVTLMCLGSLMIALTPT